MSEPVTLAFVCVQNAGRSQMATAFAEREVERRGLVDRVDIATGGTDPADDVHSEVITVMHEIGIDVSDRVPRAISGDELAACDYVATMGCSTLSLATPDDVDVRDWALPDPAGEDRDEVRAIRDQVEDRVASLFDDVFGTVDGDA
jgi:protein-tyrosine-phosphatase